MRRLPTLYLSTAPIFGHRDAGAVAGELERTVRTLMRASTQPTYLLSPCRIGDRFGLYARDSYNRSPYRRRLVRHGMSFSDDQFVELTADGAFRSPAFGAFRPAFLILAIDGDGPEDIARTRGAWLLFVLANFRFGRLTVEEMALLARTAATMEGLGATRPEVVAAALSTPPR